MPQIFPAQISDRIACKYYTMLEMVLVILIAVLLSAAAVSVFAPEEPETAEEFAMKLIRFSTSARRQTITSGRDSTIIYDREKRSFLQGSEELLMPENITFLFNGEEMDVPPADEDVTEDIFFLRADGSVTASGKIGLQDQANTIAVTTSLLTSGIYIDRQDEDITENNMADITDTVVPLWLDGERE